MTQHILPNPDDQDTPEAGFSADGQDNPPAPINRDTDDSTSLPGDSADHPGDIPPDPFNLTEIRQAQDFGTELGVKKTLKCKVRKPSKEWWIQTHPDPDFRIEAWVIDLKEEGEVYWVSPHLWDELIGEPTFVRKAFFTYTCKHMHKKGDYFLWPIRLPDEDGKLDDWNKSALDYARQSGMWQRIASNRDLGEYDQYTTDRDWGDPDWPDCEFEKLVRIAFKGRVIESVDHAVIKNLRGD